MRPSDKELRKRGILFLGDSFTEGFGLLPEQSYPSLIEAKLGQNSPWQIINGGISGDTTMDAFYRLAPLLKRHSNVEVLVVFLGANDLFNQISPEFAYSYFKKIIEEARSTNSSMRIFVVEFPSIPGMGAKLATDFESIFPRLVKEMEIELLPFFLQGVMLQPEYCLADGVHPNAAGMEKVSVTVWNALFQNSSNIIDPLSLAPES
ncbi:MAG: GDSL-type esterase/lipase family protein [Leptospiraceae bacterium]